MRTIDADAMLARLEEWNTSDSTDKALYNFTLHRILEQPTIEPQRKKGKWKMALTKDLIGFNTVCFRCSECNGMEYSTSPFCRVCGAKMEEGEANESD
jgi:hypothetical protein